MPGLLAPVCAPDLLPDLSIARGEGDVAAFVASVRRIQIFANDEWQVWQEVTGIALPDAQRPVIMEHFMVAAQAALAGQGIALVPEIIVRDHIAEGSLRLFSPRHIPWPDTFHIAHLPNTDRRPAVRDVVRWLKDEAATPDARPTV